MLVALQHKPFDLVTKIVSDSPMHNLNSQEARVMSNAFKVRHYPSIY